MLTAPEALARLKEGNRRFASGETEHRDRVSETRRAELVAGQAPLAVIFGCSDSRVPAEIVFDQGLGDLFVIRVAGNVVAPSLVASVEYAAEALGTRLVVVLGHSGCGAVGATLQELAHPHSVELPTIRAITERIRPAVETLADAGIEGNDLMRHAVRANVRASAAQLRAGSVLLEALVAEKGLVVVGAEYSLETGLVEFFEGLPDA